MLLTAIRFVAAVIRMPRRNQNRRPHYLRRSNCSLYLDRRYQRPEPIHRNSRWTCTEQFVAPYEQFGSFVINPELLTRFVRNNAIELGRAELVSNRRRVSWLA
jgi:hypothetical protein